MTFSRTTDGHAAQGDGETGGTALETSLLGQLQLTVRKNMHLRQPRAETPTEFITMAADSDPHRSSKVSGAIAKSVLRSLPRKRRANGNSSK